MPSIKIKFLLFLVSIWAYLYFQPLFAQREYEQTENYRIKKEFENPYDNLTFTNSPSITKNTSNLDPSPRQITLIKSYAQSLQNLIKKHIQQNKSSNQADGYRIQILSTTDQNLLKQTRIQFAELNTEHKTYVVYERPYYKLRIGDFLNAFEAEAAHYILLKHFPAAFIIKDKVYK